jgi:hypothetical protein
LSYAVFGKKSDGSDIIEPLETPDGRAIEVTIHKMKDDTTVMVIQDVTERRNAQREINCPTAVASRKNSRTRFIRNVSSRPA